MLGCGVLKECDMWQMHNDRTLKLSNQILWNSRISWKEIQQAEQVEITIGIGFFLACARSKPPFPQTAQTLSLLGSTAAKWLG